MIPVLETSRLRLRAPTAKDASALLVMRNAPAVFQYISKKPITPEENWRKLMTSLGHWALCGFGYWLVETRIDGTFVGDLGFGDFRRETTPSLAGTLEAGWALTPTQQGNGYAQEALTEVLRWGDTQFPARPITCLIHPDNEPSIRLATKLGFFQRCIGTYKDEASLVMDWSPSQRLPS